jgi:predicted nucleotidyltransferase
MAPTTHTHSPHSHPLPTLRTELVGDGKDGEDSNQQQIDIAGCPMPQIFERLNITPEELADFCEKWQIAELALFGSILQNDFRLNGEHPSDVDLLFSYLPGTNMSLFWRAAMKVEFEELSERKVDLMMATEVIESRNPIRRKEILNSAQIIYLA